ncbi:Protein of unknown function [Roseivivax lentus]|uniref:DUF3253 domain-containing protein n=2 Tax=Roseivivax lentus TaxID=633194 RepID=A0A1N7M766_9RHOB|nr:Protein of unknown function [Roseivivax lentus]
MRLARQRGPERSFCPSEAARGLSAEWRPLMPRIRALVARLPLVATQRGVPVDPQGARGPIRLRLAPEADQGRRGSRG